MIRLLIVAGIAWLAYLYFVEFWAWANVHSARVFFWLFP